MNLNIRRAKTGDNILIRPLQDEIAALHHEGRPDLFKTQARWYNDDVFEKMLSDPKQYIFIAELDGEVTGYAFAVLREIRGHSTYIDFNSLYIDDICVAKEHRRKGIGKLLFEQLEKIAKAHNCHDIELGVYAFNSSALAFYSGLGMKVRTLRMEKRLDI